MNALVPHIDNILLPKKSPVNPQRVYWCIGNINKYIVQRISKNPNAQMIVVKMWSDNQFSLGNSKEEGNTKMKLASPCHRMTTSRGISLLRKSVRDFFRTKGFFLIFAGFFLKTQNFCQRCAWFLEVKSPSKNQGKHEDQKDIKSEKEGTSQCRRFNS